jgi:nicotinic acid mononucleotide adenylyltransferase
MVELAIEGHDRLGVIILEKHHSSIEDSLPELAARFQGNELYLLVHEDVFRHISAWPKIHDPVQQAHLAIGLRQDRHQALVERLETLQATKGIRLRFDLFVAADIPAVSRRVRQALRMGRTPHDIDPKVRLYMVKERLYASELD